jgi:hypothetical protein
MCPPSKRVANLTGARLVVDFEEVSHLTSHRLDEPDVVGVRCRPGARRRRTPSRSRSGRRSSGSFGRISNASTPGIAASAAAAKVLSSLDLGVREREDDGMPDPAGFERHA